MAALDALKEDIMDVFQMFDEDGSGSISFQELTRALYTITGTRFVRSDLKLLIQGAMEELDQEENDRKARARMEDGDTTSTSKPKPSTTEKEKSTEQDVIDAELFVAVVLKTLNRRTYEQELVFTFHLLEDKNYPGFITKNSLKKAAGDMEERLTDQEVDEMFDKLVTGVPTPTVDFAIFSNILDAARKVDD